MNQERIGLGAFPFSNVFSKVSSTQADKIVNRFLDTGGRYIETAIIYDGVNQLLKRILKNIPRGNYCLSTKCVTTTAPDGKKIRAGKFDAIIEQCTNQLEVLELDYIDILMTHFPPPDAPIEETLSALVSVRDQGKVRDIGVSNVTLEQLREFNRNGDIRYVQNRYSLINQSLDSNFIEYCNKHGIGLIPYQVIERGQLTSSPKLSTQMRDGDIRQKKPEFLPLSNMLIKGWSENRLLPLATEMGVSIEEMIIAWTLTQPCTEIVPIGATSETQLATNMAAGALKLSSETTSALLNAVNDLESAVQSLFGQPVNKFRGL